MWYIIIAKSNMERKAFISLTVSQYSPSLRDVRAGTQGSNLEIATQEEALE